MGKHQRSNAEEQIIETEDQEQRKVEKVTTNKMTVVTSETISDGLTYRLFKMGEKDIYISRPLIPI